MEHNKRLTPFAQKLRREMTKEEKRLWYQFLKEYPIQFKRQVTCGEYILDFYCPKAKLALELDGKHHHIDERAEKDMVRTEYLNSIGIEVMRFSNKDIWKKFNQVCMQIDYMVQKRIESEVGL